jgi:hypothetical protein
MNCLKNLSKQESTGGEFRNLSYYFPKKALHRFINQPHQTCSYHPPIMAKPIYEKEMLTPLHKKESVSWQDMQDI